MLLFYFLFFSLKNVMLNGLLKKTFVNNRVNDRLSSFREIINPNFESRKSVIVLKTAIEVENC